MKKTKLKNYVVIDGKEYEGKSTVKKYSHAVVSSKDGVHSVTGLSGSRENAEKTANWNKNDCLKMLKEGYKSQAGWYFTVHELISEPIL